jgi:hypothetical protein
MCVCSGTSPVARSPAQGQQMQQHVQQDQWGIVHLSTLALVDHASVLALAVSLLMSLELHPRHCTVVCCRTDTYNGQMAIMVLVSIE